MRGPDGHEVGRGRVVSRSRPVDADPEAVLRAFGGPRVAWFPPDGPSVATAGEVATVAADGPERFDAVRQSATELLDGAAADGPAETRPRLFGGFAFHDGHEPRPPWRGFPGARFAIPRVQVVDVGDRNWLTVTDCGPGTDAGDVESDLEEAVEAVEDVSARRSPPPGIASTSRTPSREGWRQQVEDALDRIDAGDLEKVVLAQTLTANLRAPFRLADALDRFGTTYPDCFRFAFDPGVNGVFFGATPERLVSLSGDRVETEALAGSVGRGGTPEEDRRLADRLRSSAKVRHEHRVVVEAIREQLSPLATSVRAGDRDVRRLANVQHLRTSVSATLREAGHVLSLVEALHPTPAVGGRPPGAALRTIRATEQFERGWYAAPVGWFDAAGDGTFAVGIRSAVAEDRRVRLFAGNGIVADSDPEEEWDELQLKYRPVLDQLR